MFAIKFLWPLSDAAVSGIRWENLWFMAANYFAPLIVWGRFLAETRKILARRSPGDITTAASSR
jgi:hypothetical protein